MVDEKAGMMAALRDTLMVAWSVAEMAGMKVDLRDFGRAA